VAALSAEACRWHITEDQKPLYLHWHERAEQSRRRGVRQRRCPGCLRFFFPWEVADRDAASQALRELVR